MGVLTQHGYDAAHLMGKFQGQKYAAAGLPLDACSDMFVYCEEVGRVGSINSVLSSLCCFGVLTPTPGRGRGVASELA